MHNAGYLFRYELRIAERPGEKTMYETQEISITHVMHRILNLDTDMPEPLEHWELEDFEDLVSGSDQIQ